MSRMRLLTVLVVAMLVACTVTSSVPAAATSAKPTATSPSPSPELQVACELPFLTTKDWGQITAVGFLKLPGGEFHPDPTAVSTLPPGGVQDVPPPGYPHPWWDAQAKRWLPVALSSVSPDGQSYAYMSEDGLHRVVVATGADQLLYRRPKGVRGGEVLGYQAAVYVVFPSGVKDGAGGVITNPPAQVGVWKVDVVARAASRIRTSDIVGTMAGDALWITPPIGNQIGESLVRIDLATGQQTPWFRDPGRAIEFLGVDNAGLPIVWTFADGHLEIWRVTAPNVANNFYTVDYTGSPPIFGLEITEGVLIADEHGVWFGAPGALYIYDAGGFRQIATTPGIPAGPCR